MVLDPARRYFNGERCPGRLDVDAYEVNAKRAGLRAPGFQGEPGNPCADGRQLRTVEARNAQDRGWSSLETVPAGEADVFLETQ